MKKYILFALTAILIIVLTACVDLDTSGLQPRPAPPAPASASTPKQSPTPDSANSNDLDIEAACVLSEFEILLINTLWDDTDNYSSFIISFLDDSRWIGIDFKWDFVSRGNYVVQDCTVILRNEDGSVFDAMSYDEETGDLISSMREAFISRDADPFIFDTLRCFPLEEDSFMLMPVIDTFRTEIAIWNQSLSLSSATPNTEAADASERSPIVAISGGVINTIALRADGTVIVNGATKPDLKNIVAISAGYGSYVCLKDDGTVVFPDSLSGIETADWKDIIAVSMSTHLIAGLKTDGTVVATGSKDNVRAKIEYWSNIIAIETSGNSIAGLRADGTVLVAGKSGWLETEVADWNDITAISLLGDVILGLRPDGTVVAAGDVSEQVRAMIAGWTDIVAFSEYGLTAIRADGTVAIPERLDDHIRRELAGWTDIIAISGQLWNRTTYGLRSDGTLIAVREGDDPHPTIVLNW